MATGRGLDQRTLALDRSWLHRGQPAGVAAMNVDRILEWALWILTGLGLAVEILLFIAKYLSP